LIRAWIIVSFSSALIVRHPTDWPAAIVGRPNAGVVTIVSVFTGDGIATS
jgi:hypothetical protein